MTQGTDRVIAGLQIRHELLVVSAIFHLMCCIILLTAPQRALTQAVPEITPDGDGYVGNEACAKCHAAIYESYMRSAMGHKQQDCASCHMPASLGTDVAHTEVIDHRILQNPASASAAQPPKTALPELVPFPQVNKAEPPVRELALAWQSMVDAGMTMAQTQAERLLQTASRQFPNDRALLSALGYYAQKRGDDNQAGALYNRALEYDAASVDAATNLGVLEANRGRAAEAI